MSDPRASRWSYAEWASPAELPAEPTETYESWVVRNMVSGLAALRESLAARESVRQVDVPPIPDAVPLNESVRTAWGRFHSVPRALRERSAPAPVRSGPRRRPMHTIVADPDIRHLLP